MSKKSETRKTMTIAVAGVAVLTALGATIYSTLETPSAQAEDLGPLSSELASSVSSAFAEEQESGDLLPSYLQTGEQSFPEIQLSSTRFLGADESGTKSWTALNDKSEACLLVLFPSSQMASLTCQEPEWILEHGLGIQATDGESEIRAYMVPEGTDTADVSSEHLTPIGEQLLTGNVEVSDVVPVEVPIEGSTDVVELTPFEALEPIDVEDMVE